MAGDWIPMRIGLPDDPDVIAIAGRLQLDEDTVCGKLLRFWGWASQHTTDGHARSVTYAWLDRRIGVTGFCAALETRGWIAQHPDGGITVPNFSRFLGKSGKARLQSALRSARRRESSRKPSRSARDESVTREEKRREESISTSQPPAATRKPAFSEWDLGFAQRMFDGVRKVAPSAKPPAFETWANDVRLMREQDKRAEAEIEALWAWANADDFWRANILSPKKLREKWTQLEAKRSAVGNGHPARPPNATAAAFDEARRVVCSVPPQDVERYRAAVGGLPARTKAAIKAIGGSSKIREMSDANRGAVFAAFRAAYDAAGG